MFAAVHESALAQRRKFPIKLNGSGFWGAAAIDLPAQPIWPTEA